ncbi:MAG: Phosphoglycerate kinase [candidate division TM6 bacterium GW2011_GWF2_43_87]|nr:MAG: Phosphoglycerate kinase [candidate division TM6 bacterium GW2011_GWF2_43_87]
MIHSTIATWLLEGKKVFVRIDGNVPLCEGRIENDFRLRALLPTLEFLSSKKAQITVATHLGRPSPDKKISTVPIAQWFSQAGYPNITVLENLRNDPREKKGDESFAQELAQGYDFYVNDAWGVMHRADCSITKLPLQFPIECRSIGLLVERELQALHYLRHKPQRPYIAFLGGGKSEKIETCLRLIEQELVSTLVLLPGISFTFLKAQGYPIGKSLIDESSIEMCRTIFDKARQKKIDLVLPSDYLIGRLNNGETYGSVCDAHRIPDDAIGLAIGPKTLTQLKALVEQAATIFYNGAMGLPSFPASQQPLYELLEIIAQSSAYSVVGGGDSVAAVERISLEQNISFCSTGGGSTLAYICQIPLIGLSVF